METHFKYSFRNSRFRLLFILLVLCVVLSVFSVKEALPAVFLFIVVALLQFSGYKVTDDGFLKSYSIHIAVQNIQKVVILADRADVYYEQAEGKVKVSSFFPKDKTGFVNCLKELNPKIQIV